jgi:hypothetical protein
VFGSQVDTVSAATYYRMVVTEMIASEGYHRSANGVALQNVSFKSVSALVVTKTIHVYMRTTRRGVVRWGVH